MRESRRKNDNFKNIAENLIKTDSDLYYIANSHVNIIYLESDKPKTSKGKYVYGCCEKVQDKNRLFIDADFLITIYTENTKNFSEKQIETLLKHELLHIGISRNDDMFDEVEESYYIAPHDVEDFRCIIDQHGLDWSGVARV